MNDEYQPNYEISVTGEFGMFILQCMNCDWSKQFLSSTSLVTVVYHATQHEAIHEATE